jgi:hypothetical protein
VPTFVSILFAMRIGLASAPLEQATLSIRQETLAVAVENAERRAYVEEISMTSRRGRPVELTWHAPPRHHLSREDWVDLIERSLENETVANTIAWLVTQPVRVSISERRYFVSLRFSGP